MNSPVAGSFSSCYLNPHRCFIQRFEALFPHTGALGCTVCLTPQLFFPIYVHSNVGPPAPPAAALTTVLHNLPPCWVGKLPPCRESSLPSCPYPPLLPAWIKCLLYLLGCWTSIQFDYLSVLVGFFVFKLLLSFFWFWEEAQCVYLCLHLGQKYKCLK